MISESELGASAPAAACTPGRSLLRPWWRPRRRAVCEVDQVGAGGALLVAAERRAWWPHGSKTIVRAVRWSRHVSFGTESSARRSELTSNIFVAMGSQGTALLDGF